jgi:hypothetical protein
MPGDKRWDGRTVACIASGPSLTADDCERVRQAGVPAIAVNNTWQLAPWADVLYAGDYRWWARYGSECDFAGARWTCSERASREFGLHMHKASGGYNSGMRAMQLARDLGAARIIMLGYDNGLMPGDTRPHWHGRHESGVVNGKPLHIGNPDRNRYALWAEWFEHLAREMKGITIINCSRHTALACFERAALENALC